MKIYKFSGRLFLHKDFGTEMFARFPETIVEFSRLHSQSIPLKLDENMINTDRTILLHVQVYKGDELIESFICTPYALENKCSKQDKDVRFEASTISHEEARELCEDFNYYDAIDGDIFNI